jgi:hypothetical protein
MKVQALFKKGGAAKAAPKKAAKKVLKAWILGDGVREGVRAAAVETWALAQRHPGSALRWLATAAAWQMGALKLAA